MKGNEKETRPRRKYVEGESEGRTWSEYEGNNGGDGEMGRWKKENRRKRIDVLTYADKALWLAGSNVAEAVFDAVPFVA